MKILLVSSVYGSTPPSGYGGIQRVVYDLAEELVRLGHDVTLVAPPGSHCSGRTIEVAAYDPGRPWSPIRSAADLLSEEPLYQILRELLSDRKVDVIHDWSFQSLFVRRHPKEFPFVVSTCIPAAPGFERPNLVASCRAHAGLFGPGTRWVRYGLPLQEWAFSARKTDPPIHIAKIARFKGQHLAVLAALRAGQPLVLAGNVEDVLYYRAVIRPLLWISPRVRYVGEIRGTQEHLLGAAALLQTPQWFDAFPLVVLEALACGTPVIALAEGGLPEQVLHGETGFLCKSVGDIAEAFGRLPEIRPERCRAWAEEQFSARRMALEYLDLYRVARDGDTW